MLRAVLLFLLLTFLIRSISRLWAGFMQGVCGQQARRAHRGFGTVPAQPSVHMVRDPICGTYVVPERAVTLGHGPDRLHFCSSACRDRHVASARHTSAAAPHRQPS